TKALLFSRCRVITILILWALPLSLNCQTDISQLERQLEEKKRLPDPIDRDSQVIWQYNYIIETLARSQDSRTELFLDTMQLLIADSEWQSASGMYQRAQGRYHDFRGEFSEALESYSDAIDELKPASGKLQELAFAYVLKAFLLSNSELYEECKSTIQEGLPYARAANGKNSLCLMLDWYGDYYYYGLDGNRDNQKALDYYLQVQDLLPEISNTNIIADNHAVLAGLYDRLGQSDKGAFHFNIADSLCLAYNLVYPRMGLYLERGRVLEEEGDYLKANRIYKKVEEFLSETNNIEFKSRLHEVLFNNYKNLNDYKQALIYHELVMEADSKMNDGEVQRKYDELQSKYEVAIRENQINALTESKSKVTRNLILSLFVITLIGGLLILRKNSALKKSYLALQKQQIKTKEALYKGESQERRRLAAELHDNVNTKLAAARWRLESVQDGLSGNQKGVVDSTIEMLQETYEDVRHISHNLVPALLKEKGLHGSLQELIRKLNDTKQVNIRLDHTSNPSKPNIINSIAYPLYNIVSELITNVIKHAKATTCEVHLVENPSELLIEVIDDGHGYDPSSKSNGFGLRSIASRVEALRGRIHVKSNSTGTKTSIRIPI
ncbi:MAG: sensor histidine kinase, partial [Bacteroidota bacterium]